MNEPRRRERREAFVRQAVHIEYVSLAWNVIAGAGAVSVGVATLSSALLGFGLDVAIDSVASLIIVRALLRELGGQPQTATSEQRTARVIGVILVVAGVYVAAQALRSLHAQTSAAYSLVGVGLALVSLVLLPPIAYRKLWLASQLRSVPLRGDGLLTGVGAGLAGATVLGLLLTTRLGWWWTDPLAALLISGVLLREGWRSLSGPARTP